MFKETMFNVQELMSIGITHEEENRVIFSCSSGLFEVRIFDGIVSNEVNVYGYYRKGDQFIRVCKKAHVFMNNDSYESFVCDSIGNMYNLFNDLNSNTFDLESIIKSA